DLAPVSLLSLFFVFAVLLRQQSLLGVEFGVQGDFILALFALEPRADLGFDLVPPVSFPFEPFAGHREEVLPLLALRRQLLGLGPRRRRAGRGDRDVFTVITGAHAVAPSCSRGEVGGLAPWPPGWWRSMTRNSHGLAPWWASNPRATSAKSCLSVTT